MKGFLNLVANFLYSIGDALGIDAIRSLGSEIRTKQDELDMAKMKVNNRVDKFKVAGKATQNLKNSQNQNTTTDQNNNTSNEQKDQHQKAS